MKRIEILAALFVFSTIASCTRVEEKLPERVESLLAIAEDETISEANRINAVNNLVLEGNRKCTLRLCQLLPDSKGVSFSITLLGAIIRMPSRPCLPYLHAYWQQLRSFGCPPDKLSTALLVAIEKCEKCEQ